jgi:hypothetical protein
MDKTSGAAGRCDIANHKIQLELAISYFPTKIIFLAAFLNE